MSNSKLICYTALSPNCNKPRNNTIKKITIHHMAGNLTVEGCGAVFAPTSRQASSNYGIGTDGRVALYVDEANRSWCSSNPANDHQAITIEVANDGGAPNWHVSDKALASLVTLCVDICKRNGIAKLTWTGTSSGTLTTHDMFNNTCCPGPYLKGKMPYIAEQVNKQLSGTTATTTTTTDKLYRVRKSWADADSQLGAYADLANAKAVCKAGYSVFDNAGKSVYSLNAASTAAKSYAKGTAVKLAGTTLYASSTAASGIKKTGTYYLYDGAVVNNRMRITNTKANCGKTPIGNYVTGWVKKADI